MICIEDFPPGNAGEYDPSFNAFYVSLRIDFNRDEAKPKKLPTCSIYFVFDLLLGLSEMMFGDIDGDMNCI